MTPLGRHNPSNFGASTNSLIQVSTEASIGKEATEELAVMMDTFRPLTLTTAAHEYEDERYPFSWMEEPGGFKGSDSMG